MTRCASTPPKSARAVLTFILGRLKARDLHTECAHHVGLGEWSHVQAEFDGQVRLDEET